MRQLVLDMAPGTTPTLESFVAGRNAEVLHSLQEWKAGSLPERFIYLWGEPGSGKTHLLRALAPERYVAARPASRFEPDAHPLLLVDDVDRLSAEGAVSLFHRYNERRDDGEQRLLAAGGSPPARLALLPDLATRLGWGLVLRVHALDDEEKIVALQSRAAQMGVTLTREAGSYILTHWTRDMPSLFALIRELNLWSLSTHRAILTIPLIRDALATLQPRSTGT